MPETARPLRVAVVGLGTIGRAVAAAADRSPATTLAGLVEVDATVGRTAGDTLGVTAAAGLIVGDDPEALADVDVAVVCTSPRFDRVAPTLRRLFKRNIPVVAACAEMTWPWLRHPHLADVIANEARAAGVAVVGGDAYPGLGLWPALVPAATGVRQFLLRRTVVLTAGRPSVLRRCALGKTFTQFTALARQNLVGQPGLGESVVVVAQRLGRHPMRGQVSTTIVPHRADAAADSPAGRIDAGCVAGVHQRAAYQDDDLDVEIELTLALPPAEATTSLTVHAPDPRQDVFADDAEPSAAAAVLLDAARRVGRLAPGLRTVLDLHAGPDDAIRP